MLAPLALNLLGVTTHIELPHLDDATRAELGETSEGWVLTFVRLGEPVDTHFYTQHMVVDALPGGAPELYDYPNALVAYFEDRLRATGYEPTPRQTIGAEVAVWDLGQG